MKSKIQLISFFTIALSIIISGCASFETTKKMAENGNAKAQYELAQYYLNVSPLSVKYNPKIAFEWLSKSANAGNVDAMFNLGKCFKDGRGTSINKKEALKWLTKAAIDNNNSEAAIYLGKWICSDNENNDSYLAVKCLMIPIKNRDSSLRFSAAYTLEENAITLLKKIFKITPPSVKDKSIHQTPEGKFYIKAKQAKDFIIYFDKKVLYGRFSYPFIRRRKKEVLHEMHEYYKTVCKKFEENKLKSSKLKSSNVIMIRKNLFELPKMQLRQHGWNGNIIRDKYKLIKSWTTQGRNASASVEFDINPKKYPIIFFEADCKINRYSLPLGKAPEMILIQNHWRSYSGRDKRNRIIKKFPGQHGVWHRQKITYSLRNKDSRGEIMLKTNQYPYISMIEFRNINLYSLIPFSRKNLLSKAWGQPSNKDYVVIVKKGDKFICEGSPDKISVLKQKVELNQQTPLPIYGIVESKIESDDIDNNYYIIGFVVSYLNGDVQTISKKIINKKLGKWNSDDYIIFVPEEPIQSVLFVLRNEIEDGIVSFRNMKLLTKQEDRIIFDSKNYIKNKSWSTRAGRGHVKKENGNFIIVDSTALSDNKYIQPQYYGIRNNIILNQKKPQPIQVSLDFIYSINKPFLQQILKIQQEKFKSIILHKMRLASPQVRLEMKEQYPTRVKDFIKKEKDNIITNASRESKSTLILDIIYADGKNEIIKKKIYAKMDKLKSYTYFFSPKKPIRKVILKIVSMQWRTKVVYKNITLRQAMTKKVAEIKP